MLSLQEKLKEPLRVKKSPSQEIQEKKKVKIKLKKRQLIVVERYEMIYIIFIICTKFIINKYNHLGNLYFTAIKYKYENSTKTI